MINKVAVLRWIDKADKRGMRFEKIDFVDAKY